MKKLDTIESEMQPALNHGEFKAYLQPKWDIVNDHIIGGEILVRWIKPDGSMVYPSDFVPIFE
jgi:EAL domain-containing protein (putative c-di-GMP-specific phosphodiesterase class I)